MLKAVLLWASIAATSAKIRRGPEDTPALIAGLPDGFKLTDITAHDGIALKSLYFDPSPASGSASNPVIIFISSWGMNKWEYVVPAKEYAEKGYTVVSYTARGFWESGGEIDLAGANDMADVSTVIDWVISNTNGDAARIGLSGISYGGGISILGSSRDSRVKCVAAMSCWVDLAESFLGNGETIRKEAVRALQLLAELTGNPSDDLETIFTDYFTNTNLDFLYTTTYNSSAVNFIDDINKNQPAIFIANALGDSLFTPNQFPEFFEELQLQKHIEFAPGDHAGPELPGILGLPNQVWSRAGEWNDFYLLNNHANSEAIPSFPLITFNVMEGDEVEEYNSWDEVSNAQQTFELSKDESLAISVAQFVNSSSDVVASLTSGTNANINGGIPYLTATIRAYTNTEKHFRMGKIDRDHAAVFVSSPLDSDIHYRGVPTLRLNFIPQATNGTFVIYFLDVAKYNEGRLFTFSPWTFKGFEVGKVASIDVEMTMTSYDIPAGHKLAVVVQTHDPLFLDQAPEKTKIEFTAGSILKMPVHQN